MKISKKYLQKIIKEEVANLLSEQMPAIGMGLRIEDPVDAGESMAIKKLQNQFLAIERKLDQMTNKLGGRCAAKRISIEPGDLRYDGPGAYELMDKLKKLFQDSYRASQKEDGGRREGSESVILGISSGGPLGDAAELTTGQFGRPAPANICSFAFACNRCAIELGNMQ